MEPAARRTDPPAPLGTRDIELLRLLARRDGAAFESEVRGTSMGRAIPDGARMAVDGVAGVVRWVG